MSYTKRILTILGIVGLVGFCASLLFISYELSDLPTVDSQYLQTYSTSKIVDKDGNTIWQSTQTRVSPMTYEEIPEFYKTALVEVEDNTFWSNNGYSLSGIANMIIGTIREKIDKNYTARGGSTLSQQLIKNIYFDGGYGISTIKRKIQEIVLARQLNSHYSKEDILTFYVNHLQLVEGDTGIKAMMMTYFGKSPEDYKERTIENIAQQAYLVGLSQNPTQFNLYTNPENAHSRMQTVLGLLLRSGKISQDEYDQASVYDLTVNLQPRFWESEEQRQKNLKYKTYTDAVLKELYQLGYDPEKTSLTINTFLDTSVYDRIHEMASDGKYYQDANQEVGLTVIRHDGVVVAMVGGRNEDELNRATQMTRSSGSSTKPFTAYGPLLTYFGDYYNTASIFDSSPYTYPGTNIQMGNYGGYVYGNVTMQFALRQSLNTPVARIDDNILGSNRMKQFLANVNLDVKDTYSANDGIGLNISSLQLSSAYNALNNNGLYTNPRFIKSLTFSDQSTKEIELVSHQAIPASVAFTLNQVLRGVPQAGSTAAAAQLPYEGYAGKTGSVGFDPSINAPHPYGYGSSDIWYASYTNKGYSVAIWTGYDVPNTSPQVADGYTGIQRLNKDIQQYLLNGFNPPNWEKPDTVVQLSGSGLNAHYRVTDGRVQSTEYITLPDITIKHVQPHQVDKKWKDNLPEHEKIWWQEKYKTDFNIIDEKLYDTLR